MKFHFAVAASILILGLFAFTNCNKNDIEYNLDLDKKDIFLPAPAGKDSLVVTSNTGWTITGMPAWLTITPVSGNGATKILLVYTANTSTNTRSALLTINAAGTDPVTFTVIQDQPPVTISSFTFPQFGDSVITIRGSGFSNLPVENKVKINEGLATVLTAAPTILTVLVPSKIGSGKIDVKVNTKGDTTDYDFTYDWKGVVTVIAGGMEGHLDGTGTAAKFWHPAGIEFDKQGNLYIADYANSKVRKMTPGLVVSTLPGRISPVINPLGPKTDFDLPMDICVDDAGNIFVVELNGNAISKITTAGVVSILAGGSINGGYRDGIGTAAEFSWPSAIAIDASGNFLVTEMRNHKIRKITQSGVVTTLAGGLQGYAEGTGTGVKFNTPNGISIDNSGNFLVSDHYNSRIRKVTPAGSTSTFAGNGSHGTADGTLTTANIYEPLVIAADNAGNYYLCDGNGALRWITPSGKVHTIIPSIPISHSEGIAIHPDGTIYFSDYMNNRICKLEIR